MNREEVLAHFNKHFRGQFILIAQQKGTFPGAGMPVLNAYNPLVDALNAEAERFEMRVQYLIPGKKREKLPKGDPNRKCENRLCVQIRRRNGAHEIGRVFNY